MCPYCDELVNDFEDLVENLAPSNGYIKEAKRAAQRIFEQLHQDGRIARTIIAGSIGKGTGIWYLNEDDDDVTPDLDLVVCVNDEQPPFRKVYEDFEDLLLDLDDVADMRFTKCSMQFKISTPSFGDINVDLLAAQNFVKNTSQWSGSNIGEVEAMLASRNLDKKQKNAIRLTRMVSNDENRLTSSAFAEITVKVFKEIVKDQFVLDEIRLAKYWASGIDFEEYRYMPARSCMLEVVAVWAQRIQKKRSGEQRCIVSGFRRFLEAMSKLSSLDISLSNNNSNDQVGLKNYTKPMIRDPANKWNNLAEGIPLGSIKLLERQAKKTLKLLQSMRNRDGYSEYENAIDELFSHKN